MGTFLFQRGLLGLVRLFATAAVAGWSGSPISWSPDSQWLTYTERPEVSRAVRPSASPLDLAPVSARSVVEAGLAAEGEAEVPAAGGIHRIWASRRDGSASVVIEESSSPLTSPRWSTRGRSLAFGRYVPGAPGSRGRIEVVVQDGLDRRRVVLSVPGIDLDGPSHISLADLAPAWSPDGRLLAFPVPGREPTVLVIHIEAKRVVQTLDRALLPSWSPDGTKLAYLHRDETDSYSLYLVERSGQGLSVPRELRRLGSIPAPVGWGADGRSILAALERARLQPDLDLARVSIDDPAPAPSTLPLVPGVLRRAAALRGLVLDYGRNNDELCFFTAEMAGRGHDVCWSVPAQHHAYKRFHPVDPSLRIAGLAIAPDGRAVAMRFGPAEAPSPPAVVELETDGHPPTERTTLIAPDEGSRRVWLGLIEESARSLLTVSTPRVQVDNRPVGRPTILPLPGEPADTSPLRSRFARLGKFGAEMAARRGAPASRRDWEERLLFDYLKGDYTAASADLASLEGLVRDRGRRLELLALRAQILWARGEVETARDVAKYLVEAHGGPVYRVEETPIGRSLVAEPDATRGRDWASYLASRAGQAADGGKPGGSSAPDDREEESHLADPFAPNPPLGLDFGRERGVGEALPLVPQVPDLRRPEDIQAQLRALQRFMEMQQRAQPHIQPVPR